MKVDSRLKVTLLAVSSLSTSKAQSAHNGVTNGKIVLGQTAATEGPASALGRGMQEGLNLWFDHVNRAF